MILNLTFYNSSLRCIITTCCILLFLSIYAVGQNLNINFDHLSIDEGLSTGTVNCTFKDSRGYIWFGTWDGLNMYDAYGITVFKHDPKDPSTICGNFINTIAEDKDGNIWIGTRNNGLSIYSHETGSFRHMVNDPADPGSIPSNFIRTIILDSQGNLLIGTNDAGICVVNDDGKTFTRITHVPGDNQTISSDMIFSLLEDEPGKFWVGCNSGSIDYLDINSQLVKRYRFDPSYSKVANRRVLLKDRNGKLWIGTDGEGVRILDVGVESFSQITPNTSGLSGGIITMLHEMENGEIWIGTDGQGINVYNPYLNKFNYIRNDLFNPRSLSSDAVYQVYEDDAGTFWVSTFRGGVNILSPSKTKFRLYKKLPNNDNSLSFNSVIAAAESADGKIWLGTDGGGLDQFDPITENFTHYKHSTTNRNSISGNVIKCIYEDSEGILWLGTYAAGLTAYDRTNNSFRRFYPDVNDASTLGNNSVWSIIEDNSNNLWIGTLGAGLDLYDRETGTFEHHRHNPTDPTTISSDIIKTMFIDSQNRFWVGTEQGGLNLFDLNSRTFKRFSYDPNVAGATPDPDTRAIAEDSKGTIMVGTAIGIVTYDPANNNFKEHPANELLPNKVINGIHEDSKGYLWISTNYGLSRYDPNQNEILNFNKSDGLQGVEFNYTSSVKTSNGSMVFCGTEGVNMFEPEDIKLSTFNPPVVISQFSLFDKPINLGDTINGRVIFEKSINDTENILLTYKENVFSIEFASLDFVTPERNRYEYQMEGFDEDWISVDAGNRKATYMNLPPDDYIFKVKATNSDGVLSTNIKTINITIDPPWWNTWGFRIPAMLFIAAIMFGAYQWRVRSLKQQRISLRNEVASKTQELEQMIGIIGSNSEQIADTGNNLKRKSGQLANDAKTQDASAKNIEEAIEVVTVHTRKNEENAQVTNEISENTVKQLEKIRSATLKNIQEIKAISNKIHVLEEIFRQTNILAINASIEAARAGTYGTGFSVIAAEVRKLAERSKEASTEIVAMAQKGVVETEQVGSLILDFIPEVQKSAQLINEISESSKEQSSSIENVNSSLKSFFRISQQNSAVSGEIFSISSELDGLAKFLNDKISELQNSVD